MKALSATLLFVFVMLFVSVPAVSAEVTATDHTEIYLNEGDCLWTVWKRDYRAMMPWEQFIGWYLNNGYTYSEFTKMHVGNHPAPAQANASSTVATAPVSTDSATSIADPATVDLLTSEPEVIESAVTATVPVEVYNAVVGQASRLSQIASNQQNRLFGVLGQVNRMTGQELSEDDVYKALAAMPTLEEFHQKDETIAALTAERDALRNTTSKMPFMASAGIFVLGGILTGVGFFFYYQRKERRATAWFEQRLKERDAILAGANRAISQFLIKVNLKPEWRTETGEDHIWIQIENPDEPVAEHMCRVRGIPDLVKRKNVGEKFHEWNDSLMKANKIVRRTLQERFPAGSSQDGGPEEVLDDIPRLSREPIPLRARNAS